MVARQSDTGIIKLWIIRVKQSNSYEFIAYTLKVYLFTPINSLSDVKFLSSS